MRLLLALAITLAPAAAQALSCAAPNPARVLDDALRAGRDARLLIGRLTTPFDNGTDGYRFDGRVTGRNISIRSLSSGIDVSATCKGGACGELPRAPVEGLFISTDPAGGMALSYDPCGGAQYPLPDQAALEALEACVPAGGCPEETIRAFED